MTPEIEIELNPVDFITVGTVGPKGRRVFHLQAGRASQIVTLTIEKEQALALSDAVVELLNDLKDRFSETPEKPMNLSLINMDLRDPIEPLFRIAQIGLGYDETRNMVVIVAQELLLVEEDEDPELLQPRIVRLWGTREQFRAMSLQAAKLAKKGRADPKTNGRIIYYWT